MRWVLALVLAVVAGCARVDIDSVGIHENVVTGGQAQIDQGHVVDVDGLPGIWLAGHRTSHGAVFNDLPGVRVGDRVCVYSRCYTVTRIFSRSRWGPVPYYGPVVLQTSLSGDLVLLVIAA